MKGRPTPLILRAFLLLAFLLVALSGFGLLNVRGEISGLRRILAPSAAAFDEDHLLEARSELTRLAEKLDGPIYSILELVPVARQNIQAATAITDAARPVIDAALETSSFISTSDETLFHEGTVRLEAISHLEQLMFRQSATIQELVDTALAQQSGWLIPSAYEDVRDLTEGGQELSATASTLHRAMRLAPGLLGEASPRTFAVLLLNNAELRGAGGVASGIGSVTFDEGHLKVGRFRYYRELAGERPFRKVDAPADFTERFGRYGSDTTEWINVSASPDIPDLAATAAELVRVTAGQEVSGVIVVDPRGLASLLTEDDDIDSDELEISLVAGDLPRFVYSDAYERYTDPVERRAALLALAPSVLEEVTDELDLGTIRRVASAAAGGHLALYSADAREQDLFVAAGVAGELTTDSVDSLLVTLQNLGADKLDYWIDRVQTHGCKVTVGSAHCIGSVALVNDAPGDLPEYVTQGGSAYRGYLEVYLPQNAKLLGFSKDAEVPPYAVEVEDGRRSYGVNVRVKRGSAVTVAYEYELPLPEGAYSLSVRPQPLARDARIHLEVAAPDRWIVRGPEGEEDSPMAFSGVLDRTLEVVASPSRRRGLSAWWEALIEFWREPVF